MNKKGIGSKISVLIGFPLSVLLSLFAFSKSYYIDWVISIGDFKSIENNTNLFWGFLFPVIYLIILWNSGKNIDVNLKNIGYTQTYLNFSYLTAKKILILLFTIYFFGLLMNGISVTLNSMLFDKIVFSLIIVLSFSLFLIFITFLMSLIIVKLTQSKLKL